MKRVSGIVSALILAASMSLIAMDHADARRSGSFGSRGTRTFQAPAPTQTAPTTAPIERSMSPRTQTNNPAAMNQPAAANAQRPGGMFGGGFAGSMMRGLLIGGVIGLLLGHGFGGLAGMLGLILQIGLAMIVATFIMRWLANRQSRPAEASARSPQPATAMGPQQAAYEYNGTGSSAPMGSGFASEASVEQTDLDRFEQMLNEVQSAYSREDYAALRSRTTPEVMSYLAEELGQNATSGVRNEVSDVKLLQGDVSETWREGDEQFATVALRYESRDVMRDRKTNEVVSGDKDLTEATELWTFVRSRNSDWKLSAIQEV